MKNKGTINQSRRWQRGLTLLLLCVVLTFSSTSLFAQNKYELVNISYDPTSDSVFFAEMQKKMAEIRKSRPTVALVLAGGGA